MLFGLLDSCYWICYVEVWTGEVFTSDAKDVYTMCLPQAEAGPHLGPKALNVYNSVESPVSVSVW